MKALGHQLRSGILVHIVVFGLLGALVGCQRGVERPQQPLVEQSDAATDDEILFASVLDVFAEEGLDVHLQAPERGLVLTTWTGVNREVRHRWVARVVRANMGLVLNVRSEYERLDRSSGPGETWISADDPYTHRDSQRDEQKMGGAIQARFRALGGGKS